MIHGSLKFYLLSDPHPRAHAPSHEHYRRTENVNINKETTWAFMQKKKKKNTFMGLKNMNKIMKITDSGTIYAMRLS